MFITFKKWTALYLLTLLLLFAGFAAIVWGGGAVKTSKNLTVTENPAGTDSRKKPVLVIDPGHGGFDGGALSGSGTVEAQINLAVSLRIDALAKLLGVETVMTRYEDTALDSPDAKTVRERKTSDLKNRVALVNSLPDSILVSIHQNSLPESKSVHGAQVFYNGAEGSEPLALAVQDALNTVVNDRPKESKASGKDIYLLRYAEVPGILVECGFLSNPQETELLNTEEYQTRLAVTILSAVLSYME